MRSLYIILFSSVISFFAQGQESIQLVTRHFIKKDKVLFRIVPTNKKMYDLIKTNSLKITRYNLLNGNLSNEVVINEMLHPNWIADTINWMRLMRKDKNKTAFIYNALFQNKASQNIGQQEKERQEKMVYDLMLLSCDFDAEIAKACGLFFVDTSITKNNIYIYKIAIYTATNSIATKQLLTFTVNTSVISSNIKIDDLSCKAKNKICTLKWKAINYKKEYSGYNIERSDDSVNFKKINSAPVILFSSQFEKNKESVFYKDTMSQVNKKYFYRIKGINFFGEESDPSNITTAYSSAIINTIPLIDSINVIQNRVVKISWRMENNNETLLPKKYILVRSDKDNGLYKTLFESKEILKFNDFNPLSSNFYKVGAITFNNDTIYSYSRMATIIDTIPPETPLNLSAIVDSKGVVTICWKRNKEIDLQGYKIFKANALNEEFVQLNNKFIYDSSYIDKLNLKTLSKKIFYSIAATDKNFNTSIRSIAIEVKRPDTIPPAAPILQSTIPESSGIKLNFILSKSDDVLKHVIFKKSEAEKEFINIKNLIKEDSSQVFIDTTSEYGKIYTYRLTVYDAYNNFTSSKDLTIKYETGYRKKLTKVNFIVDRTLKNISLNWEYNEKGIEKFILYRKKENEQLTIIKTVDGKTLSFIDATPNIGNVYEYRIKAVLYNGAESVISDPIKVIY